jgi:hypothetical protein
MELKDCERTDEMAEAHRDPLVAEVADAFLEVATAPATSLLKEAIYSNWYPGPNAAHVIVANHDIPEEQVEAAERLAIGAMKIASTWDRLRSFRYGAVLERIGAALVARRASVRVEVSVSPMPSSWGGSGWSTPIDVMAEGDPLEFYECKCDAADIANRHIVTFDEIGKVAAEDGITAHPAFVTLSDRETLRSHLAHLIRATAPIYGAPLEELHVLQHDRPRNPVP